jgi:hypothetical protein
MKFLCLIYMNEEERDAIPAEQWEPLMQEGFDVGDELRARGVFLGGNALQPVRTGATLRRKAGRAVVHRRSVRRDQRATGRVPADRGAGLRGGEGDRTGAAAGPRRIRGGAAGVGPGGSCGSEGDCRSGPKGNWPGTGHEFLSYLSVVARGPERGLRNGDRPARGHTRRQH